MFIWRIIQSLLLLVWLIIGGTLASFFGILFFWTDAGHWVVKNIYCRGFFIILGQTPTVSGLEHLDFDRPYVFVANHESHMDTQSIYMNYPRYLHFMAKKELKYVPVVGWVISSLGMLFVDRSNSEKAKVSLQKAAEMIRSGKNIISFPEGTRSKDGEVGRFKKGLFTIAQQAGVDVVPVAVVGAREVMASGSLKITPGPIHVSFGVPIPIQEYERDLDGLVQTARDSVLEMRAFWKPRIDKLR